LYFLLKELHRTGLYGSTVSDVAEGLIANGVGRALKSGLISKSVIKKLPKRI
jgi:hypothetical protein